MERKEGRKLEEGFGCVDHGVLPSFAENGEGGIRGEGASGITCGKEGKEVPEVEDGAERWVPPVSEREREKEKGAQRWRL